MLLRGYLGEFRPHFRLESFRVIVDDKEDVGARAKDAASEATVKIHVGENRFVTTGEGSGPVGALDTALRMAISESYPEVAQMELVDYKVRILDTNVGTGATTPRYDYDTRLVRHVRYHRCFREHHRGIMERAGRFDRIRLDENGEVMADLRTKEVDDLLHVLASIDDEDRVFALLEDLFTIREIKETSQRLAASPGLLSAGKSYASIEESTGASATTIARVSKCLNYGAGGYRHALEILDEGAPR